MGVLTWNTSVVRLGADRQFACTIIPWSNEVKLTAKVSRATGATKHFIGTIVDTRPVQTRDLPVPVAVQIVSEAGGFFLLRLDDTGESVADTWHPTIDEAKRMAQVEYGVEEPEWTISE